MIKLAILDHVAVLTIELLNWISSQLGASRENRVKFDKELKNNKHALIACTMKVGS